MSNLAHLYRSRNKHVPLHLFIWRADDHYVIERHDRAVVKVWLTGNWCEAFQTDDDLVMMDFSPFKPLDTEQL